VLAALINETQINKIEEVLTIFGPKSKEVKETGESYMTSSIIGTPFTKYGD